MSGVADTALTLVSALDDLYRSAVLDPNACDDLSLSQWMGDVVEPLGRLSKPVAREVRRAVRNAQKLAAYWGAGDRVPPAEWRSAVDEALGVRAWSPSLEIARAALAEDPTPEVYLEVKERFRWVNFNPWMEGVDFDEWMAHNAEDR